MKNEIYKKLLCIQSELKAPKGQYNDYGKYKYRSCEDIFEALKPLLKEHKLVLQTNDELVNLGERYYIKATATLIDEDGTSVSNTGYAREEETKKGMDGSQITGACSSYARKYALNGLFLIDDTKDSDSTNKGEELTEEEKLKRAKEFKFETGKHEDKTIEQVFAIDQDYLKWWLNKENPNLALNEMITLVTGMKPVEIPPQEEQVERALVTQEILDLVNKTGTDIDEMNEHFKHANLTEYKTIELIEARSILEKKVKKC